jgi:uncharacterized protein with von Willebrand factor type A (vWA) domain
VRNAVLRTGAGPVHLQVDDFEVVETERRTTAAVALCVDLSFSMVLNDTWGAAKQTALALHSLVTTQFPQDAIEIIGFSDYARVLRPEQLAGLDAQRDVQGTNLQHALLLAGRHLAKHPDAEPVVLVVTDGEPTAHLDRTRRGAVLVPAARRDARADDGRGRAHRPPRRDAQRLPAGRRPAAGRLRRPRRRRAGGAVFAPDPVHPR